VIRIERPVPAGATVTAATATSSNRSRERLALDMKDPAAISRCRDLAKTADAIVEGFRPGVMERLGLGPDVLLADNPKLVYGAHDGWGQEGPMAPLAGHDINYIALSARSTATAGG
jgi:alpha-methylacyl-CoA racemase